MMHKFSINIEIEISKQILKMFLRETNPEDVRSCLRALLLINGLADNDSIQLLTSTYMKSIEFVKGAVSMETLPPAECAEVTTIGPIVDDSSIHSTTNLSTIRNTQIYLKGVV